MSSNFKRVAAAALVLPVILLSAGAVDASSSHPATTQPHHTPTNECAADPNGTLPAIPGRCRPTTTVVVTVPSTTVPPTTSAPSTTVTTVQPTTSTTAATVTTVQPTRATDETFSIDVETERYNPSIPEASASPAPAPSVAPSPTVPAAEAETTAGTLPVTGPAQAKRLAVGGLLLVAVGLAMAMAANITAVTRFRKEVGR